MTLATEAYLEVDENGRVKLTIDIGDATDGFDLDTRDLGFIESGCPDCPECLKGELADLLAEWHRSQADGRAYRAEVCSTFDGSRGV